MSTPLSRPLTRDESQLLTLFINHGQDLIALAEHLKGDIGQLIAWAAQPHIQQALEAFEQLEAFHHRRADRARRDAALDTLEQAIEDSDDPMERRRAATTILRALAAPLSRAASKPAPQGAAESGTDRCREQPVQAQQTGHHEPASPAHAKPLDVALDANPERGSGPEPEHSGPLRERHITEAPLQNTRNLDEGSAELNEPERSAAPHSTACTPGPAG